VNRLVTCGSSSSGAGSQPAAQETLLFFGMARKPLQLGRPDLAESIDELHRKEPPGWRKGIAPEVSAEFERRLEANEFTTPGQRGDMGSAFEGTRTNRNPWIGSRCAGSLERR